MWSSLLGKKKNAPSPEKRTVPKEETPPLTPEETTGNLSILERKLNTEMRCPAGKNQVFIRSLILASGPTTPRITLKCQLRRDIGQKPEVFFEHIRDVCCSNPEGCEAYKKFKDRFVPT